MNKHYYSLELHKIFAMLAEITVSDEAKQKVSEIVPSTDFVKVNKDLTETDDAFVLTAKYGTPNFKSIKDVSASLERANTGSVLNLKELLQIKDVLYSTSSIKHWYEQNDNTENSINYLFSVLYPIKSLEKRLSEAILSETEIADDASSELQSIRRKITSKENLIREKLSKLIKNSEAQKALQDNIITIRDGRFVVPVKAENKGDIPGLVHDTSASGATYFVEPMSVVEINNDIRVLLSREQAEIERIIAELSALCASESSNIMNNYCKLIELEVVFAKASLAYKMNACKPIVNQEGRIRLKKARHPLLDIKKAVPIDVNIGDGNNALIITGPNTGGKTVALKTTGLLVAMTTCGLLIPVSSQSEVAVFDNILVDIGDEQSIEQNLSTFSSHMNNIINIIKEAGPNSLVLLDEVGSGTDPLEGAALAVSIIDYLKKFGCRIMATTHYQEMKMYAVSQNGVENASCEFDVESLKPTYKLILGVPGKSNALEISKKLGLDNYIIENARERISEEDKKFENVIDALEKSRGEYEALKISIEEDKKKAEAIRTSLESKLADIEAQKQKELEKAKAQADKIIDSLKNQSNAIIDELEKIRKDKDKENFSRDELAAKARLKGKIESMYDEAHPIASKQSNYKLPRELKVGDTVKMIDNNNKGTVLSIKDSQSNVQVQFGIIKMKVSIDKLMLCEQEKVKYDKGLVTKTNVTGKSEREIRQEVDIRGMTVEEGLMEVDRFIDQCLMSGVNLITVIHGKGTGVLRSAVQRYLKQHKRVKSYRLGIYGEGENGVTIVDLK